MILLKLLLFYQNFVSADSSSVARLELKKQVKEPNEQEERDDTFDFSSIFAFKMNVAETCV